LDEETGLYYYGARYYDARTSVWLAVDPMAENAHEVSPYAYSLNNPITLVDPDGKEPIKPYAGTVQDFIKIFNNTSSKMGQLKGSQAHDAMLRLGKVEMTFKGPKPATTAPFNMVKGRYIYTEKGGWIDMAHFTFYAGKAYGYKQDKEMATKMMNDPNFYKMPMEAQTHIMQQAGMSPVGEAVQDGYAQERFDPVYSSYSYEDLPSDKFGADFGANYFDPNSKLSFGEQLENYLNNVLGATNPEKAPNYKDLPEKESKNAPTSTNKTTKPMFVKDEEK
jgi:RHS repeat-associated protein